MWENKLKGGPLGRTLYKIKGLNSSKIEELLEKCGISPSCNLASVPNRNLSTLFLFLTQLKKDSLIEDGLTNKTRDLIFNEIKLNSFRGSRHKSSLPIRGRTRSNGKTRRRWTNI